MIPRSCFGIVCGSHASNVVFAIAIMGERVPKLERSNAVVCNCVRWFHYLLDDYQEECIASLRHFVWDRASMIAPGTDVDNDPRLATLSCLYGLEVVPPDLVAFFTGDASKLQKVLLPGEDRVEALGRAFALLHKHFMVIEEKPILTRLLFLRDVFGHCL